ncbi:MAG: phenylalanine--tRNA ligase beta subunit-related protein, partial [Desulfobacteraceae bacterium]
MMGTFVISKDVFKRIPGLIIISGLLKVGKPAREAISRYLNASWSKLSQEVVEQGYKAHPLIAQWRAALRDAGVPLKRCPPSIEAIAKRATKNDTPFSINPVVDTYNAISMDLMLPFGAFDIMHLNGPLYLRVSNGQEPFRPLGSGEPQETEEGEIVYADTSDILTRHFLWRQA